MTIMGKFKDKLVDLVMEAQYIPFDNEDIAEEAATDLVESYEAELKELAKSESNG